MQFFLRLGVARIWGVEPGWMMEQGRQKILGRLDRWTGETQSEANRLVQQNDEPEAQVRTGLNGV